DEPPLALRVLGNRAFVATENALHIVDIADPAHMVVGEQQLETPETPVGLSVENNRAYVAAYEGGLQVFDVTPGQAARQIGAFQSDCGNAMAVGSNGTLAFAWLVDGLVVILDVATPANPHVVGTYRSSSPRYASVSATESTLYLLGGAAAD